MENQEEIWKYIDGYDNKYQISNLGRVKSFKLKCEKILTPQINKKGYLCIGLCKNSKIKMTRIHRLIAFYFIPNPENKRCINHKNSIRTDNRIGNLEWATYSENNFHAYNIGNRIGSALGKFGINNPSSKKIYMFNKNGEHISSYASLAEASLKTNINAGNISMCANGKRKLAGGFIWKYV